VIDDDGSFSEPIVQLLARRRQLKVGLAVWLLQMLPEHASAHRVIKNQLRFCSAARV
jgi:hypothetical protein